jgi:hypothetical protein
MKMWQCYGIKGYTQRSYGKYARYIKKKTCILIDVAIPADRHVMQKEAEKKLKYKEFMYRDTTNVKHEMYDYTGNNWNH